MTFRRFLPTGWLALLLCALLLAGLPARAADGTLLQGGTLYPRVVRLSHGAKAVRGQLIASAGPIFRSTDNGATWTQISVVTPIAGTTIRCCAGLYELPQAVGKLKAGTLIYAASYLQGGTPAIQVYISKDHGATWKYKGTPVIGGSTTGPHGLWEPAFELANDGTLVMFWSDETDPCCSQKLAQIRTSDGVTWRDQANTVRSAAPGDRPGMITVSKLPGGHFFMSYELCGANGCTVYSRTSTDGWNFGDPANLGSVVKTATGQTLQHAPLNAWSASPLSANGAILLVGQVMKEANGTVSASNGQVVFVNTATDGAGPWRAIDAPVHVPTAYDNYCPNYSSALLPAADGSSLLELASDYDAGGTCRTWFATEPWNQLPVDGASYVVSSVQAPALCLDNTGWSTTDGTTAELWDCNGAAVQNWTMHAQGGGFFSLQNAQTALCVDNTGGSTTPGNKVTLWGCATNANQAWQFLDHGDGSYTLANQSSGLLRLDDPAGSTVHGAALQVYTDNGLAPQRWVLRRIP